MSAGIPDGWTTWKRTWSTQQIVEMEALPDAESLVTIAKRMAESEGLECGSALLERQGDQATVTIIVRPADGSKPAEFRE